MDAERSYHQYALTNLERLNDEVGHFPQWPCAVICSEKYYIFASYICLHSDTILFMRTVFLFSVYARKNMTA